LFLQKHYGKYLGDFGHRELTKIENLSVAENDEQKTSENKGLNWCEEGDLKPKKRRE
jgi:hypothetical protein